jgi:hypothetical protein
MDKLKWDDLAENVWEDDTVSRLEGVLDKKYRAFLKNERFKLEVGRTAEAVQVRTTLKKTDGTLAYPVEAVLPLKPEHEGEWEDLALLLVDYLDVYWNEYLTEGRDTFVHLDWARHECEGEEFYLRGFVRNLALENQADALLQEHGTGEHLIEKISQET